MYFYWKYKGNTNKIRRAKRAGEIPGVLSAREARRRKFHGCFHCEYKSNIKYGARYTPGDTKQGLLVISRSFVELLDSLDNIFLVGSSVLHVIPCRGGMFPPAPDCQREGPSPICSKTSLSGGSGVGVMCECPQDPTLHFHRMGMDGTPPSAFRPTVAKC